MKPLLKLQKPALLRRIGFAFLGGFIICFASLFVVMPPVHILRELAEGNVPWPLIGFACLSLPVGGFMIWIGSRYRVWVFPYQFTVDFSQKICGYLWQDSWVDCVSLRGLKTLVSAPAWSESVWPWVIYAEFDDGRKRMAILNSHKQFGRETDAFFDCLEICKILSHYLEVPIEFEEWSNELIAQETERRTRRGTATVTSRSTDLSTPLQP